MAFDIKKGASKKPPRILLIGVEGVGKTSFGADLPAPLFICAEDGLVGPQFGDTASFAPNDWSHLLSFLDHMAQNELGYKSLVIDTLDWIEPKLFAHVVSAARKSDIRSIEDFGFGKGYALAADEFRQLLTRLDRVVAKGITVAILAHTQVKPFNNPVGDNYDRYEPKVCKQVAALAKEWVDAVLFARFDTWAKKDGGKAKGQGGDVRVVHTTHCAGWDAKNRYGLPETMPLDARTIMQAIAKGQPQNSEEMLAELAELSDRLPADKAKSLKEWLAKNSYSTTQLAQALNNARAIAQEA